jgi:hypothetical protein
MTALTGPGLARAEAAYAHLASFKAGEKVMVTGQGFAVEGTVTTPRQDGGRDILGAYLIVTGAGMNTTITVASMVSGRRFAIAAKRDARAGRWRYFDEAGFAAQNGDAAAAAKMAGRAAGTADPRGWPARPGGYLDVEYFAYCVGFAETAHRSSALNDLLAALREARDMGWLDER